MHSSFSHSRTNSFMHACIYVYIHETDSVYLRLSSNSKFCLSFPRRNMQASAIMLKLYWLLLKFMLEKENSLCFTYNLLGIILQKKTSKGCVLDSQVNKQVQFFQLTPRGTLSFPSVSRPPLTLHLHKEPGLLPGDITKGRFSAPSAPPRVSPG